MQETVIDAKRLVREFKGGVKAVRGVSMQVRKGEIYGFLGPNGAGKSTTVLMLTTLLPPTSGTATVAGYDIRTEGAQVRAQIGAALQEAALDPLLTGREHMKLQTALQNIPAAERSQRSQVLLDRVGLLGAADRKVKGYSSGMKRRLDLALALVHEPAILFLDEPTTGLDPQSRAALWQEVSRLAKDEGVTVFLTTQYLEEADALADRVAIINDGKIVAEDTPAKLKASIGKPTVEAVPAKAVYKSTVQRILSKFGKLQTAANEQTVSVRLRSSSNSLTEIVRALDQARVAVSELNLHAPSLDDVFLAKTGHSLEGEQTKTTEMDEV